ncbi:circadian associated repressor of transcription a [Alosa sapidissima]|uniref:circadian associated repressor of transcription a n=1 Tax=Alosa sapidissima TaxID=34773 RepID=UPI001C0A23CB|nr:circadian associated repressor of transcription a [Alosa sapidissima]
MQSLGSATKWSSHESLSSTPSFPYSESDQTEDEGDVFSEGEGEGGRASLERFSLVAASLPIHLRPVGYQRDQRGTLEGQLGGAGRNGQSPSPATPPTEGDLAFARKCSELQGYLRPLLHLLNGLKTGRFDKGLNTFQQSVAMDRLQRIVGMLQKPHLGEKYLRSLLQIEMMLKMWFPQVRLQHCVPSDRHRTTPRHMPHWHQDQLHIPVKKRKRSWSDSDSSSSISPLYKQVENPQCGQGIGSAENTPPREESESTTLQHGTDLCVSSEVSPHNAKQRGGLLPLVIAPPSVESYTDTQDSCISSTTPISQKLHLPPHDKPLPPGNSSQWGAVGGGEVGGAKGKGTDECNQYSEEAGLTNNLYCSLSGKSTNT